MWVAIHQPNFLPWLGFFHKMASVDHFVLLDRVQFTKGGVINRVRLKGQLGEPQWATVAVHLPQGLATTIDDVRLLQGRQSTQKCINILRQCYGDSPYFSLYWPTLQAILEDAPSTLKELNCNLIMVVKDWLQIPTTLSWESRWGDVGTRNDRIVNLTMRVGGSGYLSGTGARAYNDTLAFHRAGLRLVYQEFAHPEYAQRNGSWLPGCSVVDALFNVGPSFVTMFWSGVAKQKDQLCAAEHTMLDGVADVAPSRGALG